VKNGTGKRNNQEIRRNSGENKSGNPLGASWSYTNAGNPGPQELGYEAAQNLQAVLCPFL